MKKIKAILFDCDGTLVDSEHSHYLGWKRALVDLSSDLTLEEYRPYVGKSTEAVSCLLAERRPGLSPQKILELKRAHYLDLCKDGLPPIEGTVRFLKRLTGQQVKIGVCSASRKAGVVEHLRRLKIEPLLDVILSGQDDLANYSDTEGVNKPKPYIYQEAMKRLGVLPEECVVIEDSAVGVSAGVAAGCFTVAIPHEYSCHQDFSLAHLRLESLANMSMDAFLETVYETSRAVRSSDRECP